VSSRIILDIEANGLNPDKIFCIVTADVDSGQLKSYTPDMINQFNLDGVQEIIGHNILGYDIPVLERLLDLDFSNIKLTDTLVLSRLFNPVRDGGHSLAAWGQRLGYPKGDHTDFTQFTDEMLEYCERDVQVNIKTYKKLMIESDGFSEESIQLEMDVHKIINEQSRTGWLLDEYRALDLLAELKEKKMELEDKVHERFTPLPIWVEKNYPKNPYKKDGTKAAVLLRHEEAGYHYNKAGSYGRTEYPEFNLGSRQQIGRYLMHYGWQPKEFTQTGLPKVDEKVLESVEIPEAQLIAQYLLVQKRIAQVQSWVEAVENDGRVHGYVNPIGAQTNRMSHSSPNLAQVPASYSPYGKECRQCWTVPKGYKLVGCDASGLELRMLASYMNDEAYTNEVINGDIHTANQIAAGLPDRSQAKVFIYGFLYGAGDAKIGEIVGGTAKEGKRLKKKFLDAIPALKRLREQVIKAAGRGYIKGLDRRKVWIKEDYSALNYLLQSAGSIVMKKALVILDQQAKERNLDYKFVGNIHDEFQTEVAEEHADEFGKLAVNAIIEAGVQLNMKCPLDGEYKIGTDWSETH
tara:strand:- start:8608 stop:10335 length:1728 start_codon:yes stop_codon:yes gene_type:complete